MPNSIEDSVRGAAPTSHDRGEQERAFLAAIVQSSEDSIVGTDLNGVIVSWNHAAEALFGYSAQEATGRPIQILFPPDVQGDPAGVLKRVRAQERIERYETWRIAKDGRRLQVLATLAPILDARGELQGVSAMYRDISEAKRAQAELLDAKRTAEAASRAKSEFLANMSHEIRTPMNVLLGMSSLLLDTPLSQEQKEYAQSLQRGAESLLVVINDILDFSKIEAGKLDIDPVDFVLEELLGEVAAMMAELASRKALDLNLSLDPALPSVIRGDASRVRQVLVNLAGNAVKFTEKGEVTLAVGRQESQLVFEVRDTGIGVPAAVKDHIFEAFAQADGSTTRRYGGTGLGLAISKKLVALMGGEMGLESREGEGSRFWFTLPLVAAAGGAPVQAQDFTALAARKVLVVDDNETNRRIVREQLRPLGIACAEAADAMQAMLQTREAAAHGVPFDLVILDYGMPGMNGVDLTRVIRSDSRLAATRLILMTSYAEKKCRDQAMAAGVDAVLDKPVRLTEFRRCLLRVMGQAEPSAASAAADPAVARGATTAAGAAQAGNLLLVEDNPDNRKLALRILEKAGYRCDVATDGREAVDAVSRSRYATILMDCQMPVVDGFQATAAIRLLEGTARHTPIIAMTAHAMQGDREKCLAAGMDDYITKPIFRDRLLDLLARWTAPSEQPESESADAEAKDRIPVTLERDMEDLIPSYLSNRKSDVLAIARALAGGDLDSVRVIGHGMSGSGGGYGLHRITEIGRGLERAAKETDRAQIENLMRVLEDYVDRLDVSYQ